jgi:hypothetical protein
MLTLVSLWEVRILNAGSITTQQIIGSLLAILAFLPASLCTGYLAAWFTNLHGFRRRSIVERVFWSVPLSMAVSTIAAVLIGRFLSLTAVVAFFVATTVLWLVVVGREGLQLRRSRGKWNIGWNPLGGAASVLAVLWIVVAVLSLVDLQGNHKLFMNTAMLDQSYRVNWTQDVLRTGVPPVNPQYFYKHSAPMRNYYFWYVVCAAVAKRSHLSVRVVFIASTVWAGFVLAALIGLYLKHLLEVGARLRKQFLRAIALLMVTGLDLCVALWGVFYSHRAPTGDLEAWSKDAIVSWLHTLLWAPHHVVAMVCCMFAFLLAWMGGRDGEHNRIVTILLIAVSLASAFGLSIYVTFAFFLVMLFWALWQIAIERTPRPVMLLAAGGAGSIVLLLPYLADLMQPASQQVEGGSGSLFSFAVREMIPPGGLLATPFFQHIAESHSPAALNLAKLILLLPGYALELGFYFAVFLIYLVPAWRGRTPLSPAHRALLFICAATLPIISLIRSGILNTNDFGWRGALLVQFPLLLLASDVVTGWKIADSKTSAPADLAGLPHNTPQWLRSIAALALVIGAMGTFCQALMLRFGVPFVEWQMTVAHTSEKRSFSHNAYISSLGYAQLDSLIPNDAIVQFNPRHEDPFWTAADLLGVDHQVAILHDGMGCGSELGGDSSGCKAMAADIGALFHGASADQARSTCRKYAIQYLVVRNFDPAWDDKAGWVWTLNPVVADKDFRALDCR